MDTKELTLNIKELSHDLGFNLIGISQAKKHTETSKRFQNWLDMGYHASMNWLNASKSKKKRYIRIFPSG